MKLHKTSRRSFLKQFAVTAGTVMLPSIGAGAKERTAKRPNVVLIMTDDQGYGDFSCHGNPVLKTPNMDRLASQSVRLQDFHVAPVCSPTRGQLLTGIDAIRNGATSPTGQRHLLKRNLRTMGDVFAQNGYRTALYGKWHLGGNSHGHMPHERGFQDALYYLRGGVQSHPNTWNSDLFDDVLYHNGKKKEVPGYATDVWFDHGTKFAKQCHKHNEPFFLYLPLNAPHGPLLAPDKFRKPYRHLDKPTATFFAMIATVDCRLGEFVKMLEDEGMRDNTILVFLTDNGTANGEKIHNAGMRGKKGSLYEGGHRVPCWISWPKGHLRHAGDVNTLTQCQDLLPTLIDLCRLNKDPEHQMDGSSLAPLLRGKPQPNLNDRILVYQHNENMGNGLVLQGKWRLVKNELYNIADDPSQTTNVAQKHPDVVKRLKAHYEKWWKSVEPHLDLEPFRLGVTDDEDMLTAYDWWYGRRVYNWPHLRRGDRSNGRYLVCIERGGNYRISLRRWPRESGLGICDAVERYVPTDSYMAFDKKHAPFPPGKGFDVVEAKIRFGNQEKRVPVTPDSQEVVLNFYVPQGETTLQTWFIDKEGKEFGANYVYILRK
jgi:arylsulfatase A-like enzyme